MVDFLQDKKPGRGPLRRLRGFTLVEMLVVITIISILASLVLIGAGAAQRAMRRAAIKTEIDQLAGSFQEYEKRFGAFPPNAIVNTSAQQALVLADLRLHFKQAFPKHQESETLLRALAGIPGSGYTHIENGMSAAEAVYFWLGGFSSDVRFPISGKGGPSFPVGGVEDPEGRNQIYDFDLARLGPRNTAGQFAGRFVQYTDAAGQQRRINLWTYAPNRVKQPLLYFDVSRHKPVEYDPISGEVVALKRLPTTSGGPIQFANAPSFQILHAGIDDEWGDFSNLTITAIAQNKGITYPDGPFTNEISDNLVNFSNETLEDAER